MEYIFNQNPGIGKMSINEEDSKKHYFNVNRGRFSGDWQSCHRNPSVVENKGGTFKGGAASRVKYQQQKNRYLSNMYQYNQWVRNNFDNMENPDKSWLNPAHVMKCSGSNIEFSG